MQNKSLLLLVLLSQPVIVQADSGCEHPRGYLGGEGIGLSSSSTSWNNHDSAFRQNTLLNLYTSFSLNCWFGETLKLKSETNGEYLLQSHQPGSLQDSRHTGKMFFNQLSLSWAVRDNVFIDAGKLRPRYGYLYAVSPLDMLRNPHGAFRSVHVNATGDNWTSFYDEGSWGVSATTYTDAGSWDLVILPRLALNGSDMNADRHWSSLERTNSQDRYLFSYSTTGLSELTATTSLLAGTQQRVAGGISYTLNDNWIINLEGSLMHGESWRHLQSAASSKLHNYSITTSDHPFTRADHGINGDIGGGLRYTTSGQVETGIEYYGQSQGYSRSEWKRLLRDVAFTNGGYADPYFPTTSSRQVRDAFRFYAHIMADEIDKTGRQGALQGKHYLMLFNSRNRSETRAINWRTSAIINLTDGSTLANLQLSSPVREDLEIYTGTSFTFGGTGSEFSLFGEKGTYYAGLRYYW